MSATNSPWSTASAAIYGCSDLTLTSDERAFFADALPLGFILFARNVDTPNQVRALVDELRNCVGWRAPVLIDQEGGRVQRLRTPHWRSAPPMEQFGRLYAKDPDAALAAVRRNMQAIGAELADLGIDVDCAPVLDVPVAGAHDIIGNRALATDPETVAKLGTAACQGLMDVGVVPVIKHIPGHGRAASDSHEDLPVVDASRESLDAQDFVPFKALSHLPVAGMTAHVVYTAIDQERPATVSHEVIGDVIRSHIGFKGLLMSDDLGMKALDGSFTDRARLCLEAGCDVALHCSGVMDEMTSVAEGVGQLSATAAESFAGLDRYRGKQTITVDQTEIAFEVASYLEAVA